MLTQSRLELLEVADVGPDAIVVRSSQAESMTLRRDRLDTGYHGAVLLAFRAAGPHGRLRGTRPITLKAIVDRDRDGNCVGVHCVGVNLGAEPAAA